MSNHQFGDLATQLVLESRRSTQTDTLLKYNDPLVRSLIREQRDLEKIVQPLAETLQTPSPSLLIYQTAINRNKRALLVYHSHRMDFLRSMYWACGGALPHILSDTSTRAKLSPHEVDYLRSYNANVMEIKSEFSAELDIMSGIEHPPKDIYCIIRVIKTCGMIQTESGAIDFRRGERHTVLRSDIEHLIVQGYLEEV